MSSPLPTEHSTQGTFHASSKPARSPLQLIKYSSLVSGPKLLRVVTLQHRIWKCPSSKEAQQQEKSDDPVGHMQYIRTRY